MIEYLILLMLVKYRDSFLLQREPEDERPFAALFEDDKPARKRPDLRIVKWQP